MPQVRIETVEVYPAFAVLPHNTDGSDDSDGVTVARPVYEVDQATLDRWARTEAAYATMREEIDRLVRPHCPTCDHPRSRHQEWSAGWDRWGCLEKVPAPGRGAGVVRTCGCGHGAPAGR